MKVSGSTGSATVKESKSGSTGPDMKVIGRMAKLMAMESCSMRTETYMRASGWTTRRTEWAHILMRMGQSMSASGVTISNMDKDWRRGQMVPSTMESTLKERRMEKES